MWVVCCGGRIHSCIYIETQTSEEDIRYPVSLCLIPWRHGLSLADSKPQRSSCLCLPLQGWGYRYIVTPSILQGLEI